VPQVRLGLVLTCLLATHWLRLNTWSTTYAMKPRLPAGTIRRAQPAGALPGPWGFTAIVLLLNTVCFLASVLLLTR
jgi:hypothetical protein